MNEIANRINILPYLTNSSQKVFDAFVQLDTEYNPDWKKLTRKYDEALQDKLYSYDEYLERLIKCAHLLAQELNNKFDWTKYNFEISLYMLNVGWGKDIEIPEYVKKYNPFNNRYYIKAFRD